MVEIELGDRAVRRVILNSVLRYAHILERDLVSVQRACIFFSCQHCLGASIALVPAPLCGRHCFGANTALVPTLRWANTGSVAVERTC